MNNLADGAGTGFSRRSMIVGGASAMVAGALVAGGGKVAMAQETGATPAAGETEPAARVKALREKLQSYGYLWSATSPATHLGDAYSLTVTNTGSSPLKLWVSTMVMDHKEHHNEFVIEEDLELAPGDERDLPATNQYGTANHFSTRIATDAADTTALTLTVTIVDESGEQTATFNQRAFMISSFDELKQHVEEMATDGKERRKARRERRHNGHEGTDTNGADPMDGMDGMDEATPAA